MNYAALTIAGSDSGGGAGIQADLKTFEAFDVFGTSVITAVTAQNTTGVQGIFPVPVEEIRAQLNSVLEDIRIHAVKTGMLLTREAVVCVAEELTNFPELPLVVDPVMVSTSGHSLLEHDAVYAISDLLFPVASVITPNIPEAEVLSGITIDSAAGMEMAAKTITRRFGIKGAVLIKGGHLPDIQNGLVRDLLFLQNNYTWFEAPFIQTQSTHGTGCTLSAAITASLARGKSTESSVRIAKNYLTHALENGWKGLGRGKGSLKHNFKSGKIAE